MGEGSGALVGGRPLLSPSLHPALSDHNVRLYCHRRFVILFQERAFRIDSGYQNSDSNPYSRYFWGLAVRSGEVSMVPILGAVWLLGSGLAGLAGIARSRKKGNQT